MNYFNIMALLRVLGLIICANGANAATLLLKDASVIDVESGTVHRDQTLLIDGGVIRALGTRDAVRIPPGTPVTSLGGRYLIPGLWDMHVHPGREQDLGLMVANGVLGARIMMGSPQHLAWRAQIELGERLGPRLLIAGPIIEGPPPADLATVISTRDKRLVRSIEEARTEVQRQHAAGFDYVKVYNNLPADAYAALTETARRLNMPVIGHVPFEIGLRQALAQQRSIEHLRGFEQLLVPTTAPDQPGADLRSRTLAWAHADLTRLPEIVQAVHSSGAWQCPTLSIRLMLSPTAEVERYLATSEAAYLGAAARAALRDRTKTPWLSNFSERDYERAADGYRKQDQLLVAMNRTGIALLVGTDTAPWGFSTHGELERFVRAGLSPRDALFAATLAPARFAGRDGELGRIRPGYVADLVVLESDPLQRIENIRGIYAVISRGQLLQRPELDGLMQAAQEAR